MASTYIVARGGTLSKIARNELGDAKQAAIVADFNGLPNANQIFVGQRLQLPTRRDLQPAAAPVVGAWPPAPLGFQRVRDVFGDILAYIRADGTIDPRWEVEKLGRAVLPFPIPLSWDTSQFATSIRCHMLLAPLIAEVFRQIVDGGLQNRIKTYGGCYQFRAKRTGTKPPAHSWGIAIDLNTATNEQGTAGDMDPPLISLFESLGFL